MNDIFEMSAVVNELIIQIDNEKVVLTPTLTIPLSSTNFPFKYCTLSSHKPIFWKIALLEYNSENYCWRAEVIDYDATDTERLKRQKSTRLVQQIMFEKFDWNKLEPLLAGYQKAKMQGALQQIDESDFNSHANDAWDEFHHENALNGFGGTVKSDDFQTENETSIAASLPKTHFYNLEFNVSFSDATFCLGYVEFQKYQRVVDSELCFKIPNDTLLPEFDLVKSWFTRKLKSKRFQVKARIMTENGCVKNVWAQSPQIAAIDEEFIQGIKFQRTLNITRPPSVSRPDKSLFTAEELFTTIQAEEGGNVFRQDELDVLAILSAQSGVRNRKQLEYLAGLKQSDQHTIRFTLNPDFGFIFFIEGHTQNHFVWELLNSHATYIWSIEKYEEETELQFKRIEASINSIRSYGREKYKQAYRNNHHDTQLVFSVIDHARSNSAFVDGFVSWRHKLNERLV